MMTSNVEKAHRAVERRTRLMPALAILLLAQQTLFFAWDGRAVTIVQMAAWTLLALSCLMLLMTGGSPFQPRAVRELANDEGTRANRAIAIERGFAAAMLTAVLVFVVSPFEPISAQRAAHMIVSIGIAVALIMFAWKEREALA